MLVVFFSSSKCLLIFHLILSVSEKDMLKFPSVIVDLFVFPFNSVNLYSSCILILNLSCYMYPLCGFLCHGKLTVLSLCDVYLSLC